MDAGSWPLLLLALVDRPVAPPVPQPPPENLSVSPNHVLAQARRRHHSAP